MRCFKRFSCLLSQYCEFLKVVSCFLIRKKNFRRLRFDMAAKSISETITMEAKMAKALANSEAPSGSGSGGPAAAGAASTVHVEVRSCREFRI